MRVAMRATCFGSSEGGGACVGVEEDTSLRLRYHAVLLPSLLTG